MNSTFRITISLLILFFALELASEAAPGSTTPAPTSAASNTSAPAKAVDPEKAGEARKARRKDKAAELKEYQTIPIADPNLEIKGISYFRKVAASGRGEMLDVQFSLYNKDVLEGKDKKDKEYSVFVLGLHETTAPVHYPSKWRKTDPKKNVKLIRFHTLVGAEGDQLKDAKFISDVALNQMASDKNAAMLDERSVAFHESEPTFEDYLYYLTRNPEKGLKVKVFGYNNPERDKYVVSNLKVDNAELAKDMNKEAEKHTYTIQYNKYLTTVTTHHFSLYRPDFLFYNKVVILVFDPDRPKNKLIFRSIQDLGKIRLKG